MTDEQHASIPNTEVRVEFALGFEDFYRVQLPGLLAVATALTGNRTEGEDIVQDTMVKAFLRWPRVRRLERPGAWCHRVLTNACRSWARRRRTRQRWLAAQPRRERWIAAPTEDVLAFWAAVRTLPERPRTVVALHYAGDLSTAEIAEMLGVPVGTVRSDLTRARAALAAQFG